MAIHQAMTLPHKASALRPNRLFGAMKSSSILAKVPKSVGIDEYNVVLGFGRQVIAAGAGGVFTVNCPRDLVLRDLVINTDAGVATLNPVQVTAITVEGNTTLLGNSLSAGTFGPGSFYRPEFDLPAAGGTPVTINIVNNGAAASNLSMCFIID